MDNDDFILEVCQDVETCVTEQIDSSYSHHREFKGEFVNCHIYTKHEVSNGDFNHSSSYNMRQFSFSDLENNIIRTIDAPDLLGRVKAYPYVSFVYGSPEKILCKSDYWGIFPYFYYMDNHRIIISNNVYHLAKLLNKDQDLEAFYEMLFFNSTRGAKTVFKDINVFLPNQALVYDLITGKITITEQNKYEELFNLEGSLRIQTAYEKFFEKAKIAVSDAAISFSAGSDSRTILSCLLKYQMKPKIYSWGDKQYVERQKVEKLAKEIKLDINYVTFQSFEENFDTELQEGLSMSNGLLDSTLDIHFYQNIPTPATIFEGYFGSEFVKGILSDACVSQPLQDVLSNKLTLSQAMDQYFGDFDPVFKKNMESYLAKAFGHEFKDINKKKNYPAFLQFVYAYFPAKKISPICMIAKNLGLYQYLPFLDIDVLRATFSSGYGLAHYCNLQQDKPSTIVAYRPEAIVVKSMNTRLYRAELGTNIKLIESLEYPEKIVRILKKMRSARDRYLYRNCFTGQVDYRKINMHISERVNQLGLYKVVVSKQTDFIYPLVKKVLYLKYMITKII